MKKLIISSPLWAFAGLLAPVVSAAETPATTPVPAATVSAPAPIPDENKVRTDIDVPARSLASYYPNTSQARLRIYAVKRFDPEIAKPRVYFIAEMTGAAIVEPLRLDVDDQVSINAVVAILNKFKAESEKAESLKTHLGKKKVEKEAELSREETVLVELQSVESPDAAKVAASKKKIDGLKESILLGDDILKLEKLSGNMGAARLNLDRPPYPFTADFEPAKRLYTLNAGSSFQIDSKDVGFYLDLLHNAPALKKQLLEAEARDAKLRAAVSDIFDDKTR